MSDEDDEFDFSPDSGESRWSTDHASRVYTTSPSDVGDATRDAFDSTHSTDEIEARRLVERPSLNDIRWAARETFGKTLVNKPVDDAFKNGYTITNDPTNTVVELFESIEFDEQYKRTQKKARRDGFAVLFFVLEDDANGPHVDPTDSGVTVTDVHKAEPKTVDDFGDAVPPDVIDQIDGYERTDIEIRETGIVVSRRLDDPNYGDPLGYVLERTHNGEVDYQFLHRNRCLHVVWNTEVDGDYKGENAHGEKPLGRWEGDSILTPSIHYLGGTFKGSWAVAQTLFRYSSPLYNLKYPPRVSDEDELDEIDDAWQNLNATTESKMPDDFELEMHDAEGGLDVRDKFDVLFDQICAANEMTRSVLFGTMSGVVSGSETDIKNYFNQVRRLQHTQIEDDFETVVNLAFRWNQSLVPSFALGFDVEWLPLFQLDEVDAAEVRRTEANTLTMLINGFVLTPDEARSILAEEWAEYAAEIDWDELTDEQWETLEDINLTQVGRDPDTAEAKGNPQKQAQGSGMQSGQSTASRTPTAGGDDGVSINW